MYFLFRENLFAGSLLFLLAVASDQMLHSREAFGVFRTIRSGLIYIIMGGNRVVTLAARASNTPKVVDLNSICKAHGLDPLKSRR
jgi:hypothetical protein